MTAGCDAREAIAFRKPFALKIAPALTARSRSSTVNQTPEKSTCKYIDYFLIEFKLRFSWRLSFFKVPFPCKLAYVQFQLLDVLAKSFNLLSDSRPPSFPVLIALWFGLDNWKSLVIYVRYFLWNPIDIDAHILIDHSSHGI